MRAFYLVAALAVLGTSLSPFLLLKKEVPPSAGAEWDEVGKSNPGGAAGADEHAASRKPVVVYSSYTSKVRSLDPATCSDVISGVVQGSVYEGLYGYHFLKRPVEVIPVLAEGMPAVSEDGLTYTIRIKKGVKYHRNDCFGRDSAGRPKTRTVTADDFVLAFKRIADFHLVTPMALSFIEDKLAGLQDFRDRTRGFQKGDFSRYDLPLEGATAIDERTLRLKLRVRFPRLLQVLALGNYAPIPRELIDYHLATRESGDSSREPIPMNDRSPQINDFRAAVGTGAYWLAEFVDGGDIRLVRNPDFREDYYPSEGSPGDREAGLLDDAGKRLPFIDVNIMQYVPEDMTAWSLFLAGRTDVSPIPREMFQMAVTPSAQLTDELAAKGIRMVKYASPAIVWYAFNMDDPVLGRSRSLRQAICLGFNVEQYAEVLFNGRGRRAMNVVPSDFAEYPQMPPSPYARFDLAAAAEKMAAARKELEQAGVIAPGGEIPELRIDLGRRDEEMRRIGEFARIQFKRLGLRLRIELNDWPTLKQKVQNKQTQIFTMQWYADYPDPESFLQLFYSPNIRRGTNNTNFSSPEFDSLYDQSAVMDAGPDRTAVYRRMVEILNEECPVLLLTEPISFVLVQPWVHNVKPHPIGHGMYKYRRVDDREQVEDR